MPRYLIYMWIAMAMCGLSIEVPGQSRHALQGSVRDSDGALIVGARITLSRTNIRAAVTFTDETGKFQIENIEAGLYTLRVAADGFAEFEKQVAVSNETTENVVLQVGESRFTVTAEAGHSEDVNKVPQAVNMISAEALRERPTAVLAQVAEEEVGLNVQRTSPTIGAIVVRGLTGKNVVNYIDGVRFTNSAQRGGINTFFNLNDASNLQAVEVLRGPNSAQYGSDSLGGTVNLLTRTPTFMSDKAELHGEIMPGFSSADRSFGSSGFVGYGTRKISVYASAAARHVGSLRTADGIDSHSAVTRFLGLPSSTLYDRNPGTGFNQYGGSLRANYAPTDGHQLVLYYQRGQQDEGNRFDQLLGGDGNLIADLKNLMLDFGYVRYVTTRVPVFDSASVTGSYNTQREERVNQGGQGNPFADIVNQYERTTATGISFHLDRQLPGNNSFLFGGDAYRERINSKAFTTNALHVVTLSRPRVPDEASFDSAGLFIQNAWQAIPDRLRVTGAIRYSGMSYRTRAADAPVASGQPLWSDDRVRTADISGRIGAVFGLTDQLTGAFHYSRGFRYPSMTDLGSLGLTGDGFEVDFLAVANLGGTIGASALSTAAPTGIPVSKQRSEYSDNFDISIRHRNKKFDSAFTAFRLDISDPITKQALILPAGAQGQFLGDRKIVDQLPNGTVFVQDVATPVLVRANYTAARLYGFEVETRGRLTRRFSTRAHFTYVHSADRKSGLPPNIEGGTPPPTGFVSIRYSTSRFWLEAYSTLAARQDRFSSLDLGDRRTGAARSRAQIRNYFRRGACVNGVTSPGLSGCGSDGGRLIATGETTVQVQDRLLPIGATINGVNVIDDNTSVPLFTYLPAYAIANIRGGFTVTENSSIFVAVENITDSYYRNPSWGIDGTGRSLTLQLHVKF